MRTLTFNSVMLYYGGCYCEEYLEFQSLLHLVYIKFYHIKQSCANHW